MKIWHQYPFVRLLIPFIAGIIFAITSGFSVHIPLILIVLILLVYVTLALFYTRQIRYGMRWIPGFLINLLFLMAGYEITLINTSEFYPSNISHHVDGKRIFIVQVTEPTSEKPKSFKVIVNALYAFDSTTKKDVSGKLLLYFAKDSKAETIHYGDQLIIRAKLNPIAPPQNPGEFNYKSYLANRGIYDQGFVKSNEWQIVAYDRGLPWIAFGLHLRQKLMDILRSQNITGKEYAIATAILLGYDGYLEPEQIREFSSSGAMHILCVSGLHVGIIYLLLNSLLLFMDKKRWTKIIKTLLLILLIWLYGLITGFSPSVLRAATMFSFVIIGDVSRRNANIYNSLAASALVLLVLNPHILMDVGFQLSYVAVTGIVWLYRPLYTTGVPKNIVLRKIWQITAVSITATLATFPVTLFYFRQFPVLFPVTNLIAIPLASAIIYGGISVLIFSFVPVLNSLLSSILVAMIGFLNASVKFIEGLPFAVIRGIYINPVEMVLVACSIFFFCFFLLTRRRRLLFIATSSVLLLLTSVTARHYQNERQRRMVVYNVSKASAIDFINGRQNYFYADSALQNDPQKIGYHIQNARLLAGIKNSGKNLSFGEDIYTDQLIKKGRYIQYGNKRIVMIDHGFRVSYSPKALKVDWIILSHDPQISLSSLKALFDFDLLIIDSSNSNWTSETWISDCKNAGINYYAVQRQGALDLKI